jgi:hypothetical protein
MVLEKDQKLPEKIIVSDQNMRDDSSDSGELQKMHSFDVDPMRKNVDGGVDRKVFKESTKKKVQLTFENIVIRTVPKQKKCGRAIKDAPQPKVILNDVSGTILPGQFLSIIGASGIDFIQ